MKYFIEMNLNIVGCDGTDVFEADNEEEANIIGWEMALEHANSYVEVINQDDYTEEDLEEWSGDYLGGWIDISEVGFYVEEYNPKEHDDKVL